MNKIDRYIYASSIYALSDNGSFYKCSKQAAEHYVEEYQRSYGLDYTILRMAPFMVLGLTLEMAYGALSKMPWKLGP